MNYQETCEYLFNKTANFESQGKAGYKPGLDTMLALDERLGHPHRNYATIHVAGTNGKGSCSHTLSAILQVCGFRVGLYTSPHLVDFSERIRVNGRPIPEDYVVNFVEQERGFFEPLGPSFFEITTAMALAYFRDMKVDIAIIEVGLGGRLDSTNIITPVVSVITNISLDHTQMLGSSLEQIATEKAGIMKPGVPVVVGETVPETRAVFESTAAKTGSPIVFAEDEPEVTGCERTAEGGIHYLTRHLGEFNGQLTGEFQQKNTNTVLPVLYELVKQGYLCETTTPESRRLITEELNEAFSHVVELTGLKGRWQTVRKRPLVVCDTGHNVGGWQYLRKQIEAVQCKSRHIVFGMVDDKDVFGVMSLLPKDATYYYTKGSTKRAMPEQSLKLFGDQLGLHGYSYPTVKEAYLAALATASDDDFIFVGGSNYVVADFLKTCI